MAARVASTLIKPLVAKLFVREENGADLVSKPIRVSKLVSWHGQKRTLDERDVRKISEKLISRTLAANPYEPAVHDGDRIAVVDALTKTLLSLGDLEMEDVQAVHLGHVELARKLSAAADDSTRNMSADATNLYRSLVDVCCLHILQFFTQRSSFISATLITQTRMIDETMRRMEVLTARLPAPRSQDADFEQRYLEHLGLKYGKLAIFGLDLSAPGQARWPLDTAYLSLELSAQNRDGGVSATHRFRVEGDLTGKHRVVLRGPAGSGKTTLAQWLAVSAAQNDFDDELALLRGRVPFILPLRSLAQESTLPTAHKFLAMAGSMLDGAQPQGWADRVLHSGRGIILVDGIDEISESKRLLTKRWLTELTETYPRTFFLVTTRPSAVPIGWAADLGFVEFDLLPLNQRDVDKFVNRWHDAALSTLEDIEERTEVERYRAALHVTLRRKPDLYQLATNPLMCSVICALHRDRHSQLPEGRMDLYAAALRMLLVRRDKEREVIAPEGLHLTEEQQVQLLQRLAYWLIRNGRSEATQALAVRIIRERLPSMPRVVPLDGAHQVFRHLLLRSGLLREPTLDTVDFIHRTFQDYLGAKAAVETSDLDLLAKNAGDDQWEDVIRMAVGHARERERGELLRKLVVIGDQRPSQRRRYHLLAAASLENATTLDPAVRAEVMSRAAFLIPPGHPRGGGEPGAGGRGGPRRAVGAGRHDGGAGRRERANDRADRRPGSPAADAGVQGRAPARCPAGGRQRVGAIRHGRVHRVHPGRLPLRRHRDPSDERGAGGVFAPTPRGAERVASPAVADPRAFRRPRPGLLGTPLAGHARPPYIGASCPRPSDWAAAPARTQSDVHAVPETTRRQHCPGTRARLRASRPGPLRAPGRSAADHAEPGLSRPRSPPGGRTALDHVPAAQGGGGNGYFARLRHHLPRPHPAAPGSTP
ncbi:NACHT domain-containing protein [Streptomyces microflavus]|uniref:NACHT domain-containing protein n=1 Tax=Streptomyces microflavus TaxID=1919 RepID=UPI003F4E3120